MHREIVWCNDILITASSLAAKLNQDHTVMSILVPNSFSLRCHQLLCPHVMFLHMQIKAANPHLDLCHTVCIRHQFCNLAVFRHVY